MGDQGTPLPQRTSNVPTTPMVIAPPPPTRPMNPLMGSTEETYVGSNIYYYSFGGVPNPEWTGINFKDPKSITDLCYRSPDPTKGQKQVAFRTAGLPDQYKKGDSLHDFQEEIYKHLVKHGLDTIAYIPDPRNNSGVVNVVKGHAKLTGDMSTATQTCEAIELKYDRWDHKNSAEAKDFLMNSISKDLKKEFSPFYNPHTDSFALIWLKLVHHLVTSSVATFDGVKDSIRNARPSTYPGQNIQLLSAFYIEKADDLHNAGYFDNALIINMVSGFLCATRDRKGQFHHKLNTIHDQVKKLHQQTIFMNKDDQDNEFAKAKLTYKDVCYAAVSEYNDLVDQGFWEPAKLPKDKQSPAAYIAKVDKVLNLISTMSDSSGKSNNGSNNNNKRTSPNKEKYNSTSKKHCFNCGSTDHLSNKCPHPRVDANQRKKIRHKFLAPWKLEAPKSYESQTKLVNGTKFYWCEICGNWTSTHNTSQHGRSSKKGKKSDKRSKSQAETNLVTWDPSIWITQADLPQPSPSHFTLTRVITYLYIIITLAILLGLPVPSFTMLVEFYHNQGFNSTCFMLLQSISQYCSERQYILAPCLWVLAGFMSAKIPTFYYQPFNPVTDLNDLPRPLRRATKKKASPFVKLKSAKDHNLHRSFPLRLRNENRYCPRKHAPTIQQRCLQHTLDTYVHPIRTSISRPIPPHPSPQPFTSYHGTSSFAHKSKGGYISKGGSHTSQSKQNKRNTFKSVKTHLTTNTKRLSPLATPFIPYHKNLDNVSLNRPSSYKRKQKIQSYNRKTPKQSRTSTKSDYFCENVSSTSPVHAKKPVRLTPSKRRASPVDTNKVQASLKTYFSPTKKSVYKPVGIPNRRNMPNLNMTVGQYARLKKEANTVLLTGINDKMKAMAQKVSLMTPSRFQAALSIGTNNKPQNQVVWDTGASLCVTPDRDDFITYNNSSPIKHVKGIGGIESSVVGHGTVSWSIHDAKGTLRTFNLQAYHIPSSKSRLISTNALLSAYEGEHLTIDSAKLELSGINGDKLRNPVIAYNNPSTRLPTSIVYTKKDIKVPGAVLYHTVSTVDESNVNLSESQKELLRWHQRLGHLDFQKVKHLMRTGVLSHTEKTRALHTSVYKMIKIPKCAACLFGKQTAKSSPGTKTVLVKDRAGILRSGNLLPGSEVSVDHFISSVRGRLFHGFNKGQIEDRYVGGCIFVDHASSYIHVELQSSLSSHETLRAKLNYERLCRDAGVVPQTYMSDNGSAFKSRDFTEHLSNFHQISKFAGVGAHHHNAQAERGIRTIMSIARTMMIHSGIHWPDVADASLWPMAVKHACYLFNHVPSHTTGLSPSDIFTRIRWPQKRFMDLHVWGCPVYVLHKSLQDGKKIPKWLPRSRRSIYMGTSAQHASSVPLCLNTSTGAITPQFHVVFDDWFATVSATSEDIPDFTSDEWRKMFGESRYQYIVDEENEEDLVDHDDLKQTIKADQRSQIISKAQEEANPAKPLDVTDSAQQSMKPRIKSDSINDVEKFVKQDTEVKEQELEPINQPAKLDVKTEEKSDTSPTFKAQKSFKNPNFVQRKTRSSTARPKRTNTQIERLTYDKLGNSNLNDPKAYIMIQDEEFGAPHIQALSFDYYALISSKKEADPDLFSYDQAMSSEDKLKWIKAAIEEIQSLEKLQCWIEIPLTDATEKVLPGTWVFKIKRAPDGSFKKFKARYCIRGDLQEGDFETYAPVVHFSTVRLFLAWSLMLGWETFSIDFSSAFVQAQLEDPTYIHLPRGFRSTMNYPTCLKLNKSIYGLSVAPRLWFKHLWTALKKFGLKQSKHDPCLLLREDLIIICYVDDLGIQAPNRKIVDTLVQQLRDEGFALTLEGSFSEYLGIKYDWLNEDTLVMSQQGLIQKIIESTGLEECRPNRTPCVKDPLSSDEDGEPMDDPWNYRSIVGMMLYLSTNTRPDISFAVSQVARFSHNPKKSHATAVKVIVRYLSGTKSRGVVYKRPKSLNIECYVDADFAGLYGHESPTNPLSVKSRTGYIISVGGCFILCKSQLQSTIALSTSEAEYGALSQGMRTVIPLRETVLEMIESVKMVDTNGKLPFGTNKDLTSFKTVIYEDNNTALTLAIKQKVTSRTKHWCVKFHFFWSYINDEKNHISCVKVASSEQKADYLTKGLSKDLFENCRKLNQGW